MFLTDEEEAMLKGEYGEAQEIAMSVLVKLGDSYGADRMVRVAAAHIDASAYGAIYSAGLEFVERFCHSGATFQVPTTLNVSSIDFELWRNLRVPKTVVQKQHRLAEAFRIMKAILTWTCAPYQYGASIRYGQNIAWGESNAIGFANTVVGARTERLGDLTDICAAVTGRYPCFGLYLDENRGGQILFELADLDARSFSSTDYGVLGFYIGRIAENRIPVVTRMSKNVETDQLKAFCAAAAVGGSVALSHLCGITPEARTVDHAFRGVKPEEKINVGISDLDETRRELSTVRGRRAEVVCIGCPHCSIQELMKVAQAIGNKRVKSNVRLLIFTSRMAKSIAREMGILGVIEASGGKVIADSCLAHFPSEGKKILMTDSVKMAWTALKKFSDVMLDTTENCVEAAVEKNY